LILVLVLFTAGLLRQFHDRTPSSPLVSPVVGSLLFAAIFLLLLVSAREWRRGAVAGRGVRLGSLTPLLLMLLVEKWFSLTIYPAVFDRLAPTETDPRLLDAQFRAFAGLGLVLVCILCGSLSRPTRRKTWRRARPSRWPRAALGAGCVVGGCYLTLGLLSLSLGGAPRLSRPPIGPLWLWIIGGQALLGFAEELYYRGLLLSEMERLAPRLGAAHPALRRWVALAGTAALFGMEHMRLGPPWSESVRTLVFTVALGLLLGILVMISANLHYVGAVHAWINWLLLGAAPYYVDVDGAPALPAGPYIGLTLILAFVLVYARQRWRLRAGA
jgi:membrane protease YdiL (CAAX protease family)